MSKLPQLALRDLSSPRRAGRPRRHGLRLMDGPDRLTCLDGITMLSTNQRDLIALAVEDQREHIQDVAA